jgi:sugar phosphate isomerase/epimerase
MLSAQDLAGHPDGMEAAMRSLKASGLRVTGLQALRDFEGLEGALHAYKVDVAKSLLDMCRAIGSPVLVVNSSAHAQASTDRDVIGRDLRKLAMLALPFGIKIAYVALSWGRAIRDFEAALDVVGRAEMPNLGIGVDSFHSFATKSALDDLDLAFGESILLVQLSDFMVAELASLKDRIATANHLRVFPGEGLHSELVAELVQRVTSMGYHGDYSFQVFNDDYHQIDPATVAARARRSAVWLGEEVLLRTVPLRLGRPLRA